MSQLPLLRVLSLSLSLGLSCTLLSACSSLPLIGGASDDAPSLHRNVALVNVETSERFNGQSPKDPAKTLDTIQRQIAKQLRAEEGLANSLDVYLEDLKVRNAREGMFKQGKDRMRVLVAVREGERFVGGFTAIAEGGGGIMNMSEGARVKELSDRLAAEIEDRLRKGRFDENFRAPATKSLVASGGIEETVTQAAPAAKAPSTQRIKNLETPPVKRAAPRAAETLKNCTIEQVESMLSVGLATEQIRSACR